MCRIDFSDQLRKIKIRNKRIGYNLNVMRLSVCLVFNPITVNNYASLFDFMPVGRASASMIALTKVIRFSWLGLEHFRLFLGPLWFKILGSRGIYIVSVESSILYRDSFVLP